MTTSQPETPDPIPFTPERSVSSARTVLRERLLDLSALLLLLIVTAVLYVLIGPSAGMVTGTAAGLYTTYRRSTTPTDRPPGAQETQQRR